MAEDRIDPRFIENLPILLGWEEPGTQAIHANSVRRELAGDVLRKAQNAGLRCRVDEYARQRTKARHTANVENRTAAVFDHVLAENLAAEMRCEEVRMDDLLELCVGDFEVWRRGVDAGTINKCINTPELIDHLLQQ